jgi:hypothetical protein
LLTYSLSRTASETEFHDLGNLWTVDIVHTCTLKTWDSEDEVWDEWEGNDELKDRLGWLEVIIERNSLNYRAMGH